MLRPPFGSIVEIATSEGFAYAQYTHRFDKPPKWGDLIRVLPGLFGKRPERFDRLVVEVERNWLFFPLPFGRRKSRCATIVGCEAVPDRCAAFPTFRQLIINGNTGRFEWNVWDGESNRWFEEFEPEHESLPKGPSIVNDEALVEQVLRFEGRPPVAVREWREQKRSAFVQLAEQYAGMQDHVTGVNLLREALENSPGDRAIVDKLAAMYETRAKRRAEDGDSAAAAADRRKARDLRRKK